MALPLLSLPLYAQEDVSPEKPVRPIRLVVIPFHDKTNTNSYLYLSKSISDAIIKYLSRRYNYERFTNSGIKATFSGTTPAAFSEQFKTDIVIYGDYYLLEASKDTDVSRIYISTVVYVAPFDTSLNLEPDNAPVSSDLFVNIEQVVSKTIGPYIQKIFNIDTDELQEAGRKKINLTMKAIDQESVSELEKASEENRYEPLTQAREKLTINAYSTFDLRMNLNYALFLGGNQTNLFEADDVSFTGLGFGAGVSVWPIRMVGLDASYNFLNVEAGGLNIYDHQSIQVGILLRFFLGEISSVNLNSSLFIGGGLDHTRLEFSDEFISFAEQDDIQLISGTGSGFGYYMEGGLIVYYKFFYLRGSLKLTRQNPKFEDAGEILSGDLLNFTFLAGFNF